MNIRKIVVALLALSIASSGAALAQGRSDRDERRAENRVLDAAEHEARQPRHQQL
jgi:hypothetical protein